MPENFKDFDEVRLDADPTVKPDIVANMTDLGDIGEFSAIWCSHALEHLTPKDVMKALAEFRRVLADRGVASIVVPDLEGVTPTFEPLLGSVVSGHDLIYGLNDTENPWMLHRTGFVESTMRGALTQAGFSQVLTKRLPDYNLLGVGIK